MNKESILKCIIDCENQFDTEIKKDDCDLDRLYAIKDYISELISDYRYKHINDCARLNIRKAIRLDFADRMKMKEFNLGLRYKDVFGDENKEENK